MLLAWSQLQGVSAERDWILDQVYDEEGTNTGIHM